MIYLNQISYIKTINKEFLNLMMQQTISIKLCVDTQIIQMEVPHGRELIDLIDFLRSIKEISQFIPNDCLTFRDLKGQVIKESQALEKLPRNNQNCILISLYWNYEYKSEFTNFLPSLFDSNQTEQEDDNGLKDQCERIQGKILKTLLMELLTNDYARFDERISSTSSEEIQPQIQQLLTNFRLQLEQLSKMSSQSKILEFRLEDSQQSYMEVMKEIQQLRQNSIVQKEEDSNKKQMGEMIQKLKMRIQELEGETSQKGETEKLQQQLKQVRQNNRKFKEQLQQQQKLIHQLKVTIEELSYQTQNHRTEKQKIEQQLKKIDKGYSQKLSTQMDLVNTILNDVIESEGQSYQLRNIIQSSHEISQQMKKTLVKLIETKTTNTNPSVLPKSNLKLLNLYQNTGAEQINSFLLSSLSQYTKKQAISFQGLSYFDYASSTEWFSPSILKGQNNIIMLFRAQNVIFGIFTEEPIYNVIHRGVKGFFFNVNEQVIAIPQKKIGLCKCSQYQLMIGQNLFSLSILQKDRFLMKGKGNTSNNFETNSKCIQNLRKDGIIKLQQVEIATVNFKT